MLRNYSSPKMQHKSSLRLSSYSPTPPGIITDSAVLILDANKYTSGTTWLDQSGYANNATLLGTLASAYNSAYGGFFQFDKTTGNYATVAHAASLNIFDGDYTVEYWLTLEYASGTGGDDWAGIIAKGAYNENPGWGSMVVRNNPTNWGYVGMWTNNSNNMSTSRLMATWQSYWCCVQIVRSGTSMKIYSNGAEIYSGTNVTNCNNATQMIIGRGNATSYQHYGKLMLVALYDKALSQTERDVNVAQMNTRIGR